MTLRQYIGASATALAMGLGLIACGTPAPPAGNPPTKAFICKYVGTPGVDERLQTGNNPISTSLETLPSGAVVGAFFADQQGRSYFLEFDVGQAEPSPENCPPPSGGTTTTMTTLPDDDDGSTTTTTCDCVINTVVITGPTTTTSTSLPPTPGTFAVPGGTTTTSMPPSGVTTTSVVTPPAVATTVPRAVVTTTTRQGVPPGALPPTG